MSAYLGIPRCDSVNIENALETLVRDSTFFMDKKDLLDYHKKHTVDFADLQNRLSVITRLEKWYGTVSSIIHGQIPGAWVEHKSVAEIKHVNPTKVIVIETFAEGVEIVHRFFLCTTGRLLWDGFSRSAKKKFLSGLHGDLKTALALDSA